MMKMAKEIIDILIEGGKASPAPPLGPSLAPLKVNVGQVVSDINEKTGSFKGMQVPVKVTVDTDTKEYTIEVGTPPVSSMIKKEMGVDKLRHKKDEVEVAGGDIAFTKIVEISKGKHDAMLSEALEDTVKQILGTCLSGGITVDGRDPRELQKEITEGKLKIE